MTAETITEISQQAIPCTVLSGTGKRRVRLFIRINSATPGNTIDLTSYNANIADIEGVDYETDDGATVAAASAATWSTYTVTMVAAGVVEMGLICNLT